jgi:hypothetical protein
VLVLAAGVGLAIAGGGITFWSAHVPMPRDMPTTAPAAPGPTAPAEQRAAAVGPRPGCPGPGPRRPRQRGRADPARHRPHRFCVGRTAVRIATRVHRGVTVVATRATRAASHPPRGRTGQ